MGWVGPGLAEVSAVLICRNGPVLKLSKDDGPGRAADHRLRLWWGRAGPWPMICGIYIGCSALPHRC